MVVNKSKLKILAPLCIDVFAPIIIYYMLHALKVHDAVALGIGALVPGVSTGTNFIKNKKLDQLGLFMTSMLLLGIILVYVTGNPRLILIKPALFVGMAGVFCFISLASKPFIITIAKPMATEGNRRLEDLWEHSWQNSRSFQKAVKISTIAFGGALLIDAVGRIIIVYTLPVNKSVALANLPGIAAVVAAIIFHIKTVKPIFEKIKQNSV